MSEVSAHSTQVPGPPVPDWQPEWQFTGDLSHARVMAGRLAGSPLFSCPALDAKKSRPGVYPQRDKRDRITEFAPFADVPIGLVRDVVVDHVTRKAQPTTQSIVDSAVRSAAPRALAPSTELVVEAGVTGYRAALAALRAEGQLPVDAVLVPDVVVSDVQVGGGVVEWAAWGLHWIARDGVRESHLLVWRNAGSRPRADAVLGVIARAAAEGFRAAPSTSWSARFEPDPVQPPPVTRVRVREIGVLDSSQALLFDGTPQEARAMFDHTVPPALPILAGEVFRPSRACAGCGIRPECRGLPRVPGVLSVAARADYVRSLSTSDLWQHEVCPQQVHLISDLGLPREPMPEFEAARRGLLVHAWLEAAHARGIRCAVDELPTATEPGLVGEELGWTADEAALVADYLQRHPDQCPVTEGDGELVRPECGITVYDTDADVVFSTRPDLVVSQVNDSGARDVVIRETKTLNVRQLEAGDELDLLYHFPQVAAAVCILAEGVDPLNALARFKPDGSRVELELLGSDAATVISFEIGDPEVVLAARVALAQRVDTWLHDSEHAPRPGRQCQRCPVRQWCPVTVLTDQGLISADDMIDAEGVDSLPRDVLALIEADTGAALDEEFAF